MIPHMNAKVSFTGKKQNLFFCEKKSKCLTKKKHFPAPPILSQKFHGLVLWLVGALLWLYLYGCEENSAFFCVFRLLLSLRWTASRPYWLSTAVCDYGYVRLNQISSNDLTEGYSAAYVVHSHIQYMFA